MTTLKLRVEQPAADGTETYELDHTSGSAGTVVLAEDKVDWLVGEE